MCAATDATSERSSPRVQDRRDQASSIPTSTSAANSPASSVSTMLRWASGKNVAAARGRPARQQHASPLPDDSALVPRPRPEGVEVVQTGRVSGGKVDVPDASNRGAWPRPTPGPATTACSRSCAKPARIYELRSSRGLRVVPTDHPCVASRARVSRALPPVRELPVAARRPIHPRARCLGASLTTLALPVESPRALAARP